MDKQVLGSPRFVHKAGATAGLAGRVCGFGGPGWMLAHPTGSPFYFYMTAPQGTGMGKKIQKFKEDSFDLIREIPTEFALAFLLGTLPILLFSKSSKALDEMVSGLLAIGPLIDYYGWMMLPYLVLIGIKYGFRFRTERGATTFNFTHKVVTEAGTGFQTILRTGCGVAIGIALLSTEITHATTANYWMLFWMAIALLIVTSAISMFRNRVLQTTDRPTYRNPLKLDIK
ncbi:hypothetical protein [Pseudomonas carassii]|uniref:RDD family protein n=1 Tax=Pseudomonas carassii TaxID=3115855 RepID=A0ABU7HDV9_9PSED|nr:hypothetical protein [Pseudomonas sp. 137P]MEE1889515.1 hypothetical protein [Pseudomonas sp. 137P]